MKKRSCQVRLERVSPCPLPASRSNKRQFQRSKKILSRRRLESSTVSIFSAIKSLRRAAVPPVLSVDSRRAFAVPSVVYNLKNCTVHNIDSFT
jgi:hypothetical protein